MKYLLQTKGKHLCYGSKGSDLIVFLVVIREVCVRRLTITGRESQQKPLWEEFIYSFIHSVFYTLQLSFLRIYINLLHGSM